MAKKCWEAPLSSQNVPPLSSLPIYPSAAFALLIPSRLWALSRKARPFSQVDRKGSQCILKMWNDGPIMCRSKATGQLPVLVNQWRSSAVWAACLVKSVCSNWLKSDSGRPTPKWSNNWAKIGSKATWDPILESVLCLFESLWAETSGVACESLLGHTYSFHVLAQWLGARPSLKVIKKVLLLGFLLSIIFSKASSSGLLSCKI